MRAGVLMCACLCVRVFCVRSACVPHVSVRVCVCVCVNHRVRAACTNVCVRARVNMGVNTSMCDISVYLHTFILYVHLCAQSLVHTNSKIKHTQGHGNDKCSR